MATLSSKLLLTLKDGVTGPARGVAGALARLQNRTRAFQRNQRAMTGAMTGVMGRMAALGAGYIGLREGISGTIGAAMSFEDAMADVRKVIDFKSPAAFKSMRKDIVDLSRDMPITAEGFAAIYAAAGQANIPTGKLKQFATMTAKVSTAWDLTAGETGTALAEIRTALGLTVSETGLVADAINHLGNNTAASAPKLLNFTKRVSALAKTSGMAAKDASAFGAAMIAAGFAPEQAATSYINMVTRLSGGARAQKGTKQAMRLLGFEPVALQKQLKKDATGTILKVLKALKEKIPEAERISVAKSLFGAEARALAPLIDDATELKRALGLVSEETLFAGSAQREYEEASKRTSNSLKKLKNNVRAIGIGLGDIVLPSLAQWAEDAAAALRPDNNRLTIFDRIEAASDGFAKGLGFDDATESVNAFKGAMEALRTYLFGQDLSNVDYGFRKHLEAANNVEIGGVAAKFQKIGESIGGFASALQDLNAGAAASNLGQLATGLSDLMGGVSFLGVGAMAVAGAGLFSLSKGLLALMPVRTLGLMGIATGLFAIGKAVNEIANGASISEAIGKLSGLEKALGSFALAWGAWKLGIPQKLLKLGKAKFGSKSGPKPGAGKGPPKGGPKPGPGKVPPKGSVPPKPGASTPKIKLPPVKSGFMGKLGKFAGSRANLLMNAVWASELAITGMNALVENFGGGGLPKSTGNAFKSSPNQSLRERLEAQRKAALARRGQGETDPQRNLLRSPSQDRREQSLASITKRQEVGRQDPRSAIEALSANVEPIKPTVDMSEVEAGAEESEAAGARIERSLNVSAKPRVDISDITRAEQAVRRLAAALQDINSGLRQVSASATRSANRAQSQFSDGGT